jgi:EAL domain-containing protein (putative c-di-GMP-specific phosphodiesterase class I)
VLHELATSGARADRLKLELTESTVLQDVESAKQKILQLKASGVQFALDDFGTGYSSLAYLKQLPVDQVKIDRSFVKDVTDNPGDAAIVEAILGICRSLSLEVIAEGVETAAQRDFLLQHGCGYFQGFFFSRPLPITRLMATFFKNTN